MPTTLPGLRAALEAGELPPGTAFAVTAALREWYTEGDQEELEYAALMAAARESLRRVATEPDPPQRRVVVVAEVDAATAVTGGERGQVSLPGPVPLRQWASAQLDDPAAADDVRRAVAALPAAEAGDDDALFLLDGLDDHELGWYAVQELPAVLGAAG